MRRGCIGVWLVSASFQAPDFYKRLGYDEFGALETFLRNLPATINQPYTTVNLRVGISRDRLDLSLFADNVGDVRGELVSLDNGTNESTLIRPRTVGVSVSKQF